MSAARLHYGQGEFDAARGSLTALLAEEPPPAERGPALLLLGAAELESADFDAAREALTEYIDSGGAASTDARLKLAAALTADDDPAAAIDQLDLALAEGLPPPQETDAVFALARALEASGREAEALDAWQRAARDAADPYKRAEALWLLGALALRLEQPIVYQDALASLVREYPWHARALEALGQDELALTTAERARVLFQHGENDLAVDGYTAVLEQDASAAGQADARYHLALLAERADSNDDALAHYDAALAALAGLESGPLFGEIAWERALLLEALGRTDEAVAGYAALAEASPGSERAPEALFRAGLLRYGQGLPAEAIAHWSAYAALADAEGRARASFWLAKAAAGDSASAGAYFQQAASASPWDYYGLRAQAMLSGMPPLGLDEPALIVVPADEAEAERWLAAWAGPEVREPAGGSLTDSAGWQGAVELLAAGLQEEAEERFARLINEAAGDPWALYRLSQALDGEGQTAPAARAAARLIGERTDAPPAVLRLAYPADYLDLANAEAEENGFPPLLLLALIRQESFFEAGAESSAGALGLTQVIPPTADEIAGQLDEEGFVYSDLFRPNVSLRFGAHYLGSQLSLFEGDIPAALAAYNGGPGNALRWQEAAPDDPDLFVETINLSETRAYVELVLEHYARYRYAYGMSEAPSLALE